MSTAEERFHEAVIAWMRRQEPRHFTYPIDIESVNYVDGGQVDMTYYEASVEIRYRQHKPNKNGVVIRSRTRVYYGGDPTDFIRELFETTDDYVDRMAAEASARDESARAALARWDKRS